MRKILSFIGLLIIFCVCWFKLFVDDNSVFQKIERINIFTEIFTGNMIGHISVEGTSIDYPIMQHPTSNAFYLSHNANDEETVYGAIFIEKENRQDFNDWVTIVYGHATRDGSMFGTLSNFSSNEFFKTHRLITVETKQERIDYEVFAAYSFTDIHLLDTYRFTDEHSVEQYLLQVKANATTLEGNYREIHLSKNPRLLILSTCDEEREGRRFIVHAVEKNRSPR